MSKIMVHSFKINVCPKYLSYLCSLEQVIAGRGWSWMHGAQAKCQGDVDTCRVS